MEDNLPSNNHFGEEDNDSDLESRLYANIYYVPVDSEVLNEKPVTSKSFPNKTKNMDNTAILDNNKQNATSNSNESFRQNEKVINNDMKKVTRENLIENVQNRDTDPYVFNETVEEQESIKLRRKKSKKKKEAKDSEKLFSEDLNKEDNLLHDYSNIKQSDITNSSTPKNKCKESKQKKQDTESVITKDKGSQESIKQIHNKKHKETKEMESKYSTLDKKHKKKLHDAERCKNKKEVEIDSDSDESILELPVPPKPQPPVINLNDSDEENVVISEKKTKKKTSFNHSNLYTSNFKDQVKKALSKSQSELKSLKDSEISMEMEDIVLNCTEICKGASNINEIKEMKKSAQKKLDFTKEVNSNVQQQSNKVNNKKNKSGKKIVDSNNKNLDNKNKSNVDQNLVKEQNNTFASMCTRKNIQNDTSGTNLGNTNTDFTQDILPDNEFIMSQNILSPTNKRQLERENEENIENVKRSKNSENFSKIQASTSSNSNEQENKNKSDNNSFFQPMSKKLKAFYNNSRGQENFDVKEIQRKMSKDPRLWAILDDDLTLKPKSLKWKLRCTYCHQSGHLRSNCKEVKKSTTCYICGLGNHKGSRCTQRFCLTCGKKQDTFRPTCETCRTLYCKMCSAVGHVHTECPDLWRRYHQTTTTDQISVPLNVLGVMKPADRLFCCNCTKRGHDSSTCGDYRWSQHFPTPSFVSNYTDGPTYVDNINEVNDRNTLNAISEKSNKDIITNVRASDNLLPFPKELIKKKISQKKAFPQNVWDRNHNVAFIIYECGYFYTIENNGMEITYIITARKGFNTYNIMECKVVPYFVEKLKNLFMFHVKIYKTEGSNNEIVLRVRTFAHLINDLCRLILYWLSLDDDEKNHVMFMDLPLQRTDLINFLESEISKLRKETGNALALYDTIISIKNELYNPINVEVQVNLVTRLRETQTRLLSILNNHPNLRTILNEIHEIIKILKQLTGMDVPLQAYLQILTVYNFIFVPHTPPKSFINKYGKYSSPKANKNARKCNAKTNFLSENIPVWQDLQMHNKMHQSFVNILPNNPDYQTNQGPNINNLTVCYPVQNEPSNTNDFIHLENSTATYSHMIYNDSVEYNNKAEENINPRNYRSSEYNYIPGPAIVPNECYNDNNALDRNSIDYNLPSTSYDLYPVDNTSDKYTNITVNMSNKNEADKTASNRELNMNNSKIDEYQNNDKCTNIVVSVSNKDQMRTCNIKNEKEQPKNNKYTNITVSISNKDQNRYATCSSSNLNNFTSDNSQSTEVNYPENNQLNDENNSVCIEINKNAQSKIETKSLKEDIKNKNKAKKSNKEIKPAKAGQKKGNKNVRQKYDVTTRQLNKAKGRLSRLYNLQNTIQQKLSTCRSNNPEYWKKNVYKIEKMVKNCQILHITKALDVVKEKIKQKTSVRKSICMLQKMVFMELLHQKEIKNLYDGFDNAS
ncbi:uncharacterized protein LOC122517350 [Polistes fuscatus]|uniref:uncharacterized protein LOC122517350 n=1 Tax=Polistes fuscatus TaxID=30207 RepID=UPI001CA92FB7|nr:uncharacterized protein LOC122517350 [Polistes fuscatus]